MIGSAPAAMTMAATAAQACGDPGPGIQLFVNAMAAFLAALVPAIYILARRRLPLRKKMRFLLGLVLVDLVSLGLLAALVSDGLDELLSPLPWVLVLLPGFGLAALFSKEAAAPRQANTRR